MQFNTDSGVDGTVKNFMATKLMKDFYGSIFINSIAGIIECNVVEILI